jgi:hypothetical protein
MEKGKVKTLNEEISDIKKWINVLNEENRIGIGHFPPDEQTPMYRDSYGENIDLRTGTDLGATDQMDGYMQEDITDPMMLIDVIGKQLMSLRQNSTPGNQKYIDTIMKRVEQLKTMI